MPPSYSIILPGRISTPVIFIAQAFLGGGTVQGWKEQSGAPPGTAIRCAPLAAPAPKGKPRVRALPPPSRACACSSATPARRSEEHTSELQSLMRISYAVFCLKKKTSNTQTNNHTSLPHPPKHQQT